MIRLQLVCGISSHPTFYPGGGTRAASQLRWNRDAARATGPVVSWGLSVAASGRPSMDNLTFAGDVKLRSIAEPSPNLSRELTGEGSTKNSGAGIAPSPLPSPHPPPHHIVGREFSSRLVLGGSRRTVHPHTVRGLAESLAAADGKIRVRTHLILPVSRKPPPPHSPGPLRLLHYEHPLVVPQFMHL
jgi:hypothetical protein